MAAVEKGSAAYKAHIEAIEASRAFDDRGKKAWQKREGALSDLAHQVNITGRNFAALVAGLPGDLGDLVPGAGNALLANMPNSEEMAEKLGGDPSHWSWLPAALVAPGPGELKAMAGSGKALLAGEGGLLAQALFHGTPHKFSKFELEKIGTGEGAQSYGHGLYFAESPGVAKSYSTRLSGTPTMPAKYTGIGDIATKHGLSGDQVQTLADTAQTWVDTGSDLGKAGTPFGDMARAIKAGTVKKAKPGGHLYEVDIPDETIAKMLDWDAPLSEQPESVRKAIDALLAQYPDKSGLQAIKKYDMPGEHIYDRIVGQIAGRNSGGQEAASRVLNEAGIPGIRYYDGNSRATAGGKVQIRKTDLTAYSQDLRGNPNRHPWRANVAGGRGMSQTKYFATKAEAEKWAESARERGTRNIVVFNPDDITQVKRDGELVYKTK